MKKIFKLFLATVLALSMIGCATDPAGNSTTTKKYTIKIDVQDTTKGTIEVSPTSAEAGTEITVTVKPADGYELDTLTVNTVDVTVDATITSSNTYKFPMPAKDVTVKATFKEKGSPEPQPQPSAKKILTIKFSGVYQGGKAATLKDVTGDASTDWSKKFADVTTDATHDFDATNDVKFDWWKISCTKLSKDVTTDNLKTYGWASLYDASNDVTANVKAVYDTKVAKVIPPGKVNVTFKTDANTVLETKTVDEGATVAKPATDPTKTGYTFGGWYADNATAAFDFNTKITTSLNLTAKWTAIKYTISFDKNNTAASGTMTVKDCTYDATVDLTENAFTLTGYTFSGWATSASGSVVYTNGQKVKNLATTSTTVTLYAKWTINTYKVTFNTNGGSTVADVSVDYNGTVTQPSPAPTKAGNTFDGWYKEAACTNAWNFTTDKVTDAVTLYAKWIEDTLVTDLTTAPLVHHGTTEIGQTQLVNTYTLSAYYKGTASNKIYVDLTADELVKHKNAQQKLSYWAGIAIKTPATTETDKYVRMYWEDDSTADKAFVEATKEWNDGTNDRTSFYFRDDNGTFSKKGIIEVSSAEAANSTVAKTYEITFHVTPKAATTVDNLAAAPLVDCTADPIPSDKLVDADSYKVEAYYDTTDEVYVTVKAEGLVKHTAGNDKLAYWVGVAIPTNVFGSNKVRAYWEDTTEIGSFDELSTVRDAEFTEGTVAYSSFYFGDDATGDFAGKTGIIQISTDGTTAAKTYEISFNVTPNTETNFVVENLTTAPLAHHGTSAVEQKDLVDTYTLSAYYPVADHSKTYVTLTAKDLVLHENANNKKGYWVGIAIPKPESSNWYWRAGEATSDLTGNFTEQSRTWMLDGSETEYNTFYYCPDDGDFSNKTLYIQLAEAADANSEVKKTYVVDFKVTTKNTFTMNFIAGSGTSANSYALADGDYPDGKKTSDNHSADWVNDTVWLKFDNTADVNGKYVWMKFIGSDESHQAAISCGNNIAPNKYLACSFLDTANNTQWEYMADAMKDAIRTGGTRGKYNDTYKVEVYASESDLTKPTDGSSFETFTNSATLIGIDKVTVTKTVGAE